MAIVKGNVWGHLSGKIGNFCAKITAGRTILGARPISYNAPQDAATLERQKVFQSASAISTQAINLPVLKKIWDLLREQYGSGYNKLFSVNYALVSPERPTVDCVITPPDGFSAAIANPVLDGTKLTATIPALTLSTGIQADEVNCGFYAVICYHTPLAEGGEPYSFVRLGKLVPNYQFSQEYNLQIDLNVNQQAVAAKYDSSILYMAIVPQTADQRIRQYSATFVSAA